MSNNEQQQNTQPRKSITPNQASSLQSLSQARAQSNVGPRNGAVSNLDLAKQGLSNLIVPNQSPIKRESSAGRTLLSNQKLLSTNQLRQVTPGFDQRRDSSMAQISLGGIGSGSNTNQAIGLGLQGPKGYRQPDLNNLLFNEDLNLEDVFETNPNWFAFETRIRKMVLAMLEPQVKKSIQDRETIGDMRKQHDLIKRKIDECEFIIHKAQKKTASQEDTHKKIEGVEQKQKLHEVKVKECFDKLQHQQDILIEKLDIVEQERSSFIMRVDNLSYEQNKFKQELISIKESLTGIIEKTHLDLKKSIATFNNQIEAVAADIQLEKKKILVQANDFKMFGHTIEMNNRRLQDIEDLLNKAIDDNVNNETFNLKIAALDKEIRLAQESNFKVELQIRETNNYIDKYIPMHTQIMIDESLHAMCIKKATLLKCLYEYEKAKFRLLEERIKGINTGNGLASSAQSMNQSQSALPVLYNQQSQQFNVPTPTAKNSSKHLFTQGMSPQNNQITSNQILIQNIQQFNHSPTLVKQSTVGTPSNAQALGLQSQGTSLFNQHAQHQLQLQQFASQQIGGSPHLNQVGLDRKFYVIPNFHLRELELQRNKHIRNKKDGKRMSKLGAFKLPGPRGLMSDSSQGNINTFQRTDSSGSKISKFVGKTSGVKALKGKKKKHLGSNGQIASSQDLQSEAQKLQLITSQRSSQAQIKNGAIKGIQFQHLDAESQEDINFLTSSQVNLNKAKSKSSTNQEVGINNQILVNDSGFSVHVTKAPDTPSMDQKAKSDSVSSQYDGVNQKSEGIQQIIELSEESLSESVTKSVKKRAQQIKQGGIDGAINLDRIEEIEGSQLVLDEDTPLSKQQQSNLTKPNLSQILADENHTLKTMGGQRNNDSGLNFEPAINQATEDNINKVNPLVDEASIDQIHKQSFSNKQNESVEVSDTKLQIRQQDEFEENEFEGEEYDEEDEDDGDEDDDDDDEDYDSDDSSNPRYRLTASMYERLQRTEIREQDLEEALIIKFQEYRRELDEIKQRFPISCKYSDVEVKFEEVLAMIEGIKTGVRVLADSNQQQFAKHMKRIQDDREHLQSEISALEKKRRRDINEVTEKHDTLRTYIQNVEKQVRVLEGKDDFYKNICVQLIEVAKVDNALMLADEKDRKSISLLGIKEDSASQTQQRPLSPVQKAQNSTENTNTVSRVTPQRLQSATVSQIPIIQLDKACFNCSQQPVKVIQAFKMACLSYFPSPVTFQEQQFSRQSLIELKNSILQDLLGIIFENKKKQDELDRALTSSKLNLKNGSPYRQLRKSSSQTSSREAPLFRLTSNINLDNPNHISVAMDKNVPVLTNVITSELLSKDSQTISQGEYRLERKIITLDENLNKQSATMLDDQSTKQIKVANDPLDNLDQDFQTSVQRNVISKFSPSKIINSNDLKKKQKKLDSGDSKQIVEKNNKAVIDIDDRQTLGNKKFSNSSYQDNMSAQEGIRQKSATDQAIKLKNIAAKTDMLWSDHHQYPQFHENFIQKQQILPEINITSPSNAQIAQGLSQKQFKIDKKANELQLRMRNRSSQFDDQQKRQNSNYSGLHSKNSLSMINQELNQTYNQLNINLTSPLNSQSYSNTNGNHLNSTHTNISLNDYGNQNMNLLKKRKSRVEAKGTSVGYGIVNINTSAPSNLPSQLQIYDEKPETTNNTSFKASRANMAGADSSLTNKTNYISSAPLSPSTYNGVISPSSVSQLNIGQIQKAQALRQQNNYSAVNQTTQNSFYQIGQQQRTPNNRL